MKEKGFWGFGVMVRGSVHSLLVKEDIRTVGTTSPTFHVAVVAPHLLPFWSPEESKEKPHGHQGVSRIYFIPISYVATYPGLTPFKLSDKSLTLTRSNALIGRLSSK